MPVKSRRLFLALWPDEPVVQLIKQDVIPHFSQCNGRGLQPHNWHITLAYFGMATPQQRDCLEQAAASVESSAFELELSACGWWKKPAVAWLAPSSVPGTLSQLAHDIQQGIQHCGYEPEQRQYRPHITLVRKAKQRPAVTAIPPIPWSVNRFCLAESVSQQGGVQYRVLKEWDL